MREFIKDILPKISRYSKKLDELTLLTNQHWVMLEANSTSKVVLIFRDNSELIVSTNGKVEKGKWEYLGNNSLIIEKPSETLLFKHGFFDTTILVLKIDGTFDYAIFVNETKLGKEFNTVQDVVDFLSEKYITKVATYDTKINPENLTDKMNPIFGNNGLWGYLDPDGNIILDYIFDKAYKFKENLAVVVSSEKYGMIDTNGHYIIAPKYEYLESFSEDLALARMNRKFGYIDISDNTKVDFIYDDAESFENGIAKVKLNGKVLNITKG